MSAVVVAGPGAVLRRCDPTVLLVVVVGVPLVLLRVYEPAPLLALWACAVVGVVLAARVPVRRLLLAQLPFVSFALSLVMVNAVTRSGGDAVVVAAWGPVEVTDLGLRTGFALGVRTLLVGVCAVGFLATAEPSRLLTSLHQVGRLPVRVTSALLAAHRLLDDLPAEWVAVRRAHAVREPVARQDGRRRLSTSPRVLGRVAFVLLATSIRRAERVAISLESRGLGALRRGERTVWRPAGVGAPDVVLVAVVGGTLAAVLVLL
ncbi:energy-coupling factor transporter transmembrane protein EcfT [Actinotalea sp. K2]|uniref:energy-coupling factor transporter transmembrane component T family protein n=1 Tax=Actinotalea sp. K2 TaxID=2939438 RepID=UPI002017D1B4|nr:energy-coupling factor transporter transmembrane component T [Actinotalea sp. K2]MCL3862561.1 energy-coupling factor transporter transmembrane protein EcfT [Actinotalea sp. K2]